MRTDISTEPIDSNAMELHKYYAYCNAWCVTCYCEETSIAMDVGALSYADEAGMIFG